MNKMRRHWKLLVGFGVLLGLMLVVAGCAGEAGSAGPAGADGMDAAATCSQCHNDTTLIVSKSLQSAQQGHMTGTATAYAGSRASCTGCHSSEGMTAMVAAGLMPDDMEEAPANPSNPNCRTCHEIHTTYTDADWAIEATDPVQMLMSDAIFDRGNGNLCATCHRGRRSQEDVDFSVGVDSTHWGMHHGSEPDMLLGEGAYGVSDSVSVHYTLVENGCPTCHVADGNHTLNPSLAGCQSCHADLDTFDRNGVQTEVTELFEELGALLEAKGLAHFDEEAGEWHPAVGMGTEAEIGAAWNFMFVLEDGSMGVHNPGYTKAMLESAIATLE